MQQCTLGIRNYAQGSAGRSELGAAASTKAVWWDLRLASLLTHLFMVALCNRADHIQFHPVYGRPMYNRADHYIFMLFLSSSFFFFYFLA